MPLHQEVHRHEHRGERDYALGINLAASENPHLISSLNIDAPKSLESVKSLESAPKLASKITG
eukprot:5971705-Pleurochrysis_carterae.AAC.1